MSTTAAAGETAFGGLDVAATFRPVQSTPTTSTLERPACAVCERHAAAPLIRRKGHQLVRCRDCGLVYVSPRPGRREDIDALYTNASYSARQVKHSYSPGRMQEARWRVGQLERFVGRRGALLDVGCSAGSFLIAARASGWQVRGIDVSPAAVGHASTALGLDTRLATLEDAPFAPATFDVITLFECIEHLRHPAAALRAAARLLKDEGVIVITTPNIDGFVPRSTYHLLGRTIGAWEHPTPPHHLYQFSRRTLSALLEKTGFRVTAVDTRPMGLKFTARQLSSAVIEALKQRVGGKVQETGGEKPARPRRARRIGHALRRHARGVPRAVVSSLCWSLTVALYAVPAPLFGAGDSMLVVAQKTVRRGASSTPRRARPSA